MLNAPLGPTRSGYGAFIVLLLALLLSLPGGAAAQDAAGRISGRAVSAHTGEPLPSAQLTVAGAGRSAVADAAGRYTLTGVPAGEHAVSVQAPGYAPKTVTGVVVRAGEATPLDVSLEPEALALEGITVSARRERGSTTALLSDRQRAATVVDALGAEQISRTPDGDAAAALKRVPGVSVVDGKFVYVRGLGERYGATTLNGAPLPSPLPDKKAVPLDLIPSGLLESVVTAKTYSPDQPGDYAGGLVQLETRSHPASEVLRLSTSVGFESNTSLAGGLDYAGGRFDRLGFDDGSRSGAAGLPVGGAGREAFAGVVAGPWAPVARDRVPLNESFGLTYGNELYPGGKPLGFIATGSYSSAYATTDGLVERYYALGVGPAKQVDYDGRSTTHSVALGGLLSAGLEWSDATRFSATAVYNRLVDDQARELGGLFESQGPYIRAPRLQYVANELVNTQLRGEHLLAGLGDLDLRWRAGYSRAWRYEPNTRTVVYRGDDPDGPFTFYAGPSSGLVFHQDLAEDGVNGAVDLKLPFSFRALPASLAFGAFADVRDRDVYTRRFRLVPNGGDLAHDTRLLPPDELFDPARIGTGPGQFGVVESTFREDNYTAGHSVHAGYAMLDAELLPRLRVVAGARLERARQTVEMHDLLETPLPALPGAELDDTDLLPALNLTYALGEETNLRLGASQTVARPQFRELTPFLFADYYGGLVTRGNPYLERSRIRNLDLRWEWFFQPGALLSAGAFHKSFDRPIEPFALVLGSSPAATWVNTGSAELSGAELELRSSFGFVAEALEALSLNLNLTVVRSAVSGDSVTLYDPDGGRPLTIAAGGTADRPLFGQSPFVANLGVSYELPDAGTTATVLYNRFGRRLDAFGGAGLPDVYEEGRSQLDLVVGQSLGHGVELKLSAGRLLGGRVEFTQTFPNGEKVTTRRYDAGRTLSLSLSWEPGSR